MEIETASIWAGGRIPLPASVLEKLGVTGGDYLIFLEEDGKVTLSKATANILKAAHLDMD